MITDDRQSILDKVRASCATGKVDGASIQAEAAALLLDRQQIQQTLTDTDLVRAFVNKATSERVTATVEELGSVDEVPDAVKQYLQTQNLPLQVCLQKRAALLQQDWAGIETHFDIGADEDCAVTWAEYGVAESGSLVFWSCEDGAFLNNFLPLHHLVVLEKHKILSHMEDVWEISGSAGTEQHRVLSLITGTSGTADIEAINIRGAHGPRFMHILLLAS